jgi:exosortase/archaeosortase family protein
VILGFAALVAAVNGLAGYILTNYQRDGVAVTVAGLAGVSAFVWFALYAVARIGLDDEARRPADRLDLWIAGLALAASFVPIEWAGSFAVLAIGLHLALTGGAGSAERRMAIVLLALTGTLIWGRLLIRLVAPSLLDLDAAMVGAISGTGASGNLVGFRGGGHFILAPSCSSLHNMSLAVLFWASLGQLLRQPLTRRSLAVCLAGVAAMLAGNLARLATLALYPSYYTWLHDGGGAQIFAWSSIVFSSLVIGYGFYLIADKGDRRGAAPAAARAQPGPQAHSHRPLPDAR